MNSNNHIIYNIEYDKGSNNDYGSYFCIKCKRVVTKKEYETQECYGCLTDDLIKNWENFNNDN